MKPIIIIPARYGSSRFPGKPLADIKGRTMIQCVYEQAMKVVPDVWVATDDVRIENVVEGFNGKCVLTSPDCNTGTDRLAQAIGLIPDSETFDVVINVQGDEPFIAPEQIKSLIEVFEKDSSMQISTLVKKITSNKDLFNPNKPKVAVGVNGNAIYFSRSPIPYLRDFEEKDWCKNHVYYKHIGIYGYKREVLLEIAKLPQTEIEKAESLEQIRWLEYGYKIGTSETEYENMCVDTPEDLQKILLQISYAK